MAISFQLFHNGLHPRRLEGLQILLWGRTLHLRTIKQHQLENENLKIP